MILKKIPFFYFEQPFINFPIYFLISTDTLRTPTPALDDNLFQSLVQDLKLKKRIIVDVNRNEATAREFISCFMCAAVGHVAKDDTPLQLKIEDWLDGPRGYGPIDYSVDVDGVVVLVHEAKKEDFEKGAAQNIVQMHSAVQVFSFFLFFLNSVTDNC